MLSESIKTLIEHARNTTENVDEVSHIPFENIGELLFRQGRYFDTKPFLIFYSLDGTRIEYGYKDFFMLAQQCANLMRSQQVKRGDRILTISHNHADTVIQYFAAWLLGACVVPISISEDDDRIKYIVENSRATLAFLRCDYQERLLPILQNIPTLKGIIICGDCARAPELLYFDELLEASDPFFTSDEAVNIEDEALIVYTSGTTGHPKGVVLTQRNLLSDAKGISEWHGMTNAQRMMCVLPIHHVNGTIVTLVTPMYFGGSIVLNQKFQSEHFFERITTEKVNVVSVVPTLLAFLIEFYKRGEPSPPAPLPAGRGELRAGRGELDAGRATIHVARESMLRHIICGAGPLTVELAQQFEEMFDIPIVHGYGLSETTCYSCFLPIDLSMQDHAHWMRDFGFPSIGVALPQNEMMIADDQGNPLSHSEKGEIAIRGVNVMKYYYENDDANEKTFSYGWFRSGDEGFYEVDSVGRKFFFITGRLKELIIRGGVNISPLEIDEVIARCPNVKAGISVGFENNFYGEEVGAYVEKVDGATLTAEEVIQFCKEHLPFSKAPKVVVFGNDIPVTSTGKYQRNKCKPLFREWKDVQFRRS